jgi:Asp-tRNA(Asn)/Glu-tRNA(Gln) amidotransferase B subunit
MLNDLAAMMKKSGIDSPHDALPVETFRDIMELLYEDHIDRKTARLAVQWAIERHQEVRDFLRFVSERMKAEAAK